jgi:hypothetical protein
MGVNIAEVDISNRGKHTKVKKKNGKQRGKHIKLTQSTPPILKYSD